MPACSDCQEEKPKSEYSKNQLKKKAKRKCQSCIAPALEEEMRKDEDTAVAAAVAVDSNPGTDSSTSKGEVIDDGVATPPAEAADAIEEQVPNEDDLCQQEESLKAMDSSDLLSYSSSKEEGTNKDTNGMEESKQTVEKAIGGEELQEVAQLGTVVLEGGEAKESMDDAPSSGNDEEVEVSKGKTAETMEPKSEEKEVNDSPPQTELEIPDSAERQVGGDTIIEETMEAVVQVLDEVKEQKEEEPKLLNPELDSAETRTSGTTIPNPSEESATIPERQKTVTIDEEKASIYTLAESIAEGIVETAVTNLTTQTPFPTPNPSANSLEKMMIVGTSDTKCHVSEVTLPESEESQQDNVNHVRNPSDGSTTSRKGPIRLGICAMDKKARSKPMGEILSRLDKDNFDIIFFGDELILNESIDEWPVVEALIAFYSSGFPLQKAEQYVDRYKPFVLNDLKMQHVLMDRRSIYDLLEKSGIDVPRHVFMNRDGYVWNSTDYSSSVASGWISDEDSMDGGTNSGGELIEHDDYIEVNGVVINKPFVEKPVDADDHNIAIYYPTSAGGGCKKLFRKIGDRSSEFYPHINEIRREGSFIYEEFVETQGTDVKMYTVGPDYGHAEARKSPTVDGKVERNRDGKEVRFPVILTLQEKEIARRIVLIFKQQVCGFDLLRVQEGDSLVSYVCDVNGWSFVKKSKKYYDDCAQILTEHMTAALRPKSLTGFSALDPLLETLREKFPIRQKQKNNSYKVYSRNKMPDDPSIDMSETSFENSETAVTLDEGAKRVRDLPDMLIGKSSVPASASSSVAGDEEPLATKTHQEELLCVIAIVRHGDRTPKQKLKVDLSEPLILKYFHKYSTNCKKDLKIKDKKPMTEFLHTVREIIKGRKTYDKEISFEAKERDAAIFNKIMHMRDVLERWKIGGLNRKLQIKPREWIEYVDSENGAKVIRCVKVQLILKWGGNLTKLGEKQAINLGRKLRHGMYPDSENHGEGGILRLHSTFRHDLKIKTSDEGRVMKTAASFAKGLLELEGEIPPILVSLVHKEKSSIHMLDPSGNKNVKKKLEVCKEKVNANLQKDFNVDGMSKAFLMDIVGPTSSSLNEALGKVGNPRKALFEIRDAIRELLDKLDNKLDSFQSDMEQRHEGGEGLRGDEETDEALSGIKLYKGETLLELTERWRYLFQKLYDEESDIFDLSRIPDVHDNVRFDMLHNPHLELTMTLEKLYKLAKIMADCVVPQEYGTTIEEKRSIGNEMCRALIEKIKYDLIIARTDNQVDMRYMIQYSDDFPVDKMGRRVRTRLYFTSESHLHTLLNVLRFPSSNESPLSSEGKMIISSTPELCYLTQIVIRLFENTNKREDDPKRYRIEILFSPGASATPLHMSTTNRNSDSSRNDTEPLQLVSKENLTCADVEEYFNESMREGNNDDDDNRSNISTVDCPRSVKEILKEKAESTADCDILNEGICNKDFEVPSIINKKQKVVTIDEEKNTEFKPSQSTESGDGVNAANNEDGNSLNDETNEETEFEHTESTETGYAVNTANDEDGNPRNNETNENEKEEDKNIEIERMAKVLAKQYLWSAAALTSLCLGVGFLFLARSIHNDSHSKRWSRR